MTNKPLIFYQDNAIIAANKPARLASVPAPNISLGQTLFGRVQREITNAIAGRTQSVYPLHRLDYATSGIVLFGKNSKDRTLLENIHRHSKTSKTYLALVTGLPPAKGVIDYKIPARQHNILIDAHTEYRVLARSDENNCSLVEIRITTGRRHQIRRHFAMIKFPIVLDNEYENRRFNQRFRRKFRLGRHFLHAWKIAFMHPILDKYIQLAAPLAPDLFSVLKQLKIPMPIA